MPIAYYAGSFDPMTHGHLDVLVQGLAVFKTVCVGVGVSATKKGLFSFDERAEMIRSALSDVLPERVDDIRVETFSGLAVEAAQKAGAVAMIRGLRDTTDFNYEMQIAGMNAQMAPAVQTIFFPARSAHRHITATLVRQIAAMDGDISAFVPGAVLKAMQSRAGTAD
ncbi:pantetheine-phosphate adenylyltransferase [Pseudohoeflea coraliihabitans]|uniref:Phosphopantetheine adenylyltransferase n=1 Tax=Pseudohoeflea coraliihabitans TaxID=2860393 RepID=A0ABS6WQL5_9HYPH|nr:pantetheine-phosphate adenylyltransferase [Pseudohoeflea sp. DP4N28-3]MBW3098246.1 pantetheine-phosphate adenylyltransferase [Pseudohoeflea sp. DP4N28-3]